ncbi:glycoside hydrolase family 32 protein [Paenibacillus sp. BR2-3]|uniref:glycoside hydrolase family 32 protein n=1 Tax=Paenibacillus sp. BR2-3 TaxID=3048494 RepID=UPI003977901B
MTTLSYTEAFRPQFHFTPEAHWMNDPNGMVYFEGEYHLFYQYHPESTTWGPMHWGHAVSRDLIHWEHLPIALKPDHNGFIFSGSAVVDEKDTSGFFSGGSGLVALFTHADEYPDTGRPRQRQSLSYSLDKGRSWTMYEGNPVLSDETITDFRDPKVFWHEPLSVWVMAIAAGDHIRFYTSGNLKEWSLASEFGATEGSHDGVWECPDLIKLPVDGNPGYHKWVLIVSIGDHPELREGSRIQYFVGDFDGYRFTNNASPDTILWLDHGRDNYAGVTWSNADQENGGKLYVGWMSNWKYANLTPTSTWRSAMTLPRVLSLVTRKDGVRVAQTPVVEVEKLRRSTVSWEDIIVEPGCNLLAGHHGDRYEIEISFEPGSASEVGLKLRTSGDEETVVGYDVLNRLLFVDRSNSGTTDFQPHFGCKHSVPLELVDGMVTLRLFMDWSSIEVFADEGAVAITDQIFPDLSSTGMELYTIGGSVKVISLQLHELDSIYTGMNT